MSPGKISERIILDRIAWAENMVREIQSLSLDN
jgi:hypothetical protein